MVDIQSPTINKIAKSAVKQIQLFLPNLNKQVERDALSDGGFEHSLLILCCYFNATSKFQIVRITNVPGFYFERVVSPGKHLLFEACSEAMLEIHTGDVVTAILSDKIKCEYLRVSPR